MKFNFTQVFPTADHSFKSLFLVNERVEGATYFHLYLQRFEVDSSLARLPGYSLTREPRYHGTPLVPRPSKVCTFHPRSAWNLLPSGRLVTSPLSHNSRWFVVSCHTSHNRIRNETSRWNILLVNKIQNLQVYIYAIEHLLNAEESQICKENSG